MGTLLGKGGRELEQRAGRGAKKACFGVTVGHGLRDERASQVR